MNTDSEARRAAIYVRISSDPTGRAAGIERQEQDCRALADQLHWTVVTVHRDNDVSAYSGKPRPGYRSLLDDIRAARVDAVIAWHPDRLYRRLPDLEELTQAVQEHQVAIRTVRAGAVDLSTASGVMTAEILASVSKHEVAHSIERVAAAKAQAAARGLYRGGPRPFGYEADGITVREDEARHVRNATDAVISGESIRSIAKSINEAGARTVARRYRQEDGTRGEPESREWSPNELRKMLLRPRNAGLIEHRGEIVGKAQWPALIDEETWTACRDILTNPERRTTTGSARQWLGSGLFRCGVCNGPLKTSSTGTRGKTKTIGGATFRGAYRCRNAADGTHVTRVAGLVDEHVMNLAIERLSRPDAHELLLPPEPKDPHRDLAAEANTLRAKLDGLAADYAADLVTRKQFLDGTELVRKRLDAVTERMATRAATSVLASLPLGTPDIAEQWAGFHLDKRRAIIDALMTVTVLPARRGRLKGFRVDPTGKPGTYFDTECIKVEWKSQAG